MSTKPEPKWFPATEKIREDRLAIQHERGGEIVATFEDREVRDRVIKLLRADDLQTFRNEEGKRVRARLLAEKNRGGEAVVNNPVPTYAEVIIRYRDGSTKTLKTHSGYEAGKKARAQADEWNEKWGGVTMGFLDDLFGKRIHGPKADNIPDTGRAGSRELERFLRTRVGLSERDARRVRHALFDPSKGFFAEAINRGMRITIMGFGSFYRRERTAGQVRNPRTGEVREIGARHYPAIRWSKTIKESIRDPEA